MAGITAAAAISKTALADDAAGPGENPRRTNGREDRAASLGGGRQRGRCDRCRSADGGRRCPHQTGIGGYGGHATLAVNGGRRITSIDFNSMVPAAAKNDVFPLDGSGKVIGQKNMYGWLAAGVPGILAGLGLALALMAPKAFATVQPAIELAAEWISVCSRGSGTAGQRKAACGRSRLAVLYFRDGKPLEASDRYSNPDLARLLERLAKDDWSRCFIAAISRTKSRQHLRRTAGWV